MNQPIDPPPFERIAARFLCYALTRIAEEAQRQGVPSEHLEAIVLREIADYFPKQPHPSLWGNQP